MKLRTKAAIFFGSLLFLIALAIFLYAEYIIGGVLKEQTAKNFRIIVEQSESTYFAIKDTLRTRVLDWSSDITLQNLSKGALSAVGQKDLQEQRASEFAAYIKNNKIPYDQTIFLVDLIGQDGVIVASTNIERIGRNEKVEKTKLGDYTHGFDEIANSKFGEVFISGVVIEERENPSPFIHAGVRIFSKNKNGAFEPSGGVLMVHFSRMAQIAETLGAATSEKTSRKTSGVLLSSYNTSEIYLVNKNRIMVTPSRNVPDMAVRRQVDTFPVKECLDNSKEILGEYDNYQGVRVLGSSMCFPNEGDVLIVEVQKAEIFAPMTNLVRVSGIVAVAVFIFGGIAGVIFIRRPFAHLDMVIKVLNQAVNGDFNVRAPILGNDETADLARAFNVMIESVQTSQEKLKEASEKIQKEALELERDVESHEKQEEFLEQSRRAQVNLLEDAWQAKERLEVEKNRLQTILASIGDGLLIIDGGYRVVMVNPAAEAMFEIPKQELISRDLRDVLTIWKKRKDIIPPTQWPTEEVFLTKKIHETTLEEDLSISTENHSEKIPVSFSIAPLGGTVAGAVIVLRDVTKDRELDDAKSGFISVASHQLRTPLTTIRWYAEMLLSGDAGELTASQRDFLTEVHGGAQRLYQTVDLLLGISRVESGKIKTDKVPIDIGVFTKEIVAELSPQIEEKNLVFTATTEESTPVVVELDSLTLRQVILNLFSNAIRYTNESGIIEIKWSVKGDTKELVYSVRDNGIGIPENQRARIFSKFYRAENARSWAPDGSGLGLALVKDLVESWGGKVWFESTEGQGTTFFFTVPL